MFIIPPVFLSFFFFFFSLKEIELISMEKDELSIATKPESRFLNDIGETE